MSAPSKRGSARHGAEPIPPPNTMRRAPRPRWTDPPRLPEEPVAAGRGSGGARGGSGALRLYIEQRIATRGQVSGIGHPCSFDNPWIPAFAGMTDKRPCRHSREGGNPSVYARQVCRSTGHATRERPCRHSREGGNPSVYARPVCRSTGHAKCKRPCRHSREGGNPSVYARAGVPEHRTRQARASVPSFPRRRESIGVRAGRCAGAPDTPSASVRAVIPARAGIHTS